MTYSIELQEDKRALLVTWHPDFNFLVDGEAVTRDIMTQLETATQPIFFVNEVRQAAFTYEELIEATNQAARGENPMFKHPKILGAISVTTNEIVRRAAQGMDSAVFNNTKVWVVSNLDDAYAIIQQNLNTA